MAKKNSGGGAIVIIGLIVLVMVAKYWYLLVAVGVIALIIWGITKAGNSWSSSETQNTNQQPSARQAHIETAISGSIHHQSNSSARQHQPNRSDTTVFGAGVQQPKSASPETLWVPCGKTIQHAGYTIRWD